jgi:hypothetical protein
VVLDANGLDDAQMQAIARWTGRVSVRFRAGRAWIGGACLTVVKGTILA